MATSNAESARLADAGGPIHLPTDQGRTSPGPVPLLRREADLPAEPVATRL